GSGTAAVRNQLVPHLVVNLVFRDPELTVFGRFAAARGDGSLRQVLQVQVNGALLEAGTSSENRQLIELRPIHPGQKVVQRFGFAGTEGVLHMARRAFAAGALEVVATLRCVG